ncbi:MAG: magnesium/cobalt transporter CorA [Spirosomataceae bacterium]
MSKHFKIAKDNLNTSPGTLTYVGKEVTYATRIHLIEYDEDSFQETEVKQLHDCLPDDDTGQVSWLNVDGIHEANVIDHIGKHYELHPLLLEDVMNTQQKPKLEYFNDDVLFLTFKSLEFNPYNREIEQEHVCLVLGDDWLISFQEERMRDLFAPVLQRIKASAGKTRRNGADYLLFSLMDTIVDGYFTVLEKVTERLEDIEERVTRKADNRHINDIYALKRELTFMRKAIYPLREILSSLIRNDQDEVLIRASTNPYLRDTLDHIIQIIETIDSYRELIASLMDLHLSSISNHLNEVMKVLTIISVIFLPLNLIVGYYGMNFDALPGIHGPDGHLWVLGGMIAIVAGMMYYFKRQNWL